ncbi:pentapeptide repeat-containing protein [Nostoc sp. JL33]|uniref:pentapeptide repeat-containing protein n=1 Tax=Nostoc sp. JL33 TaxID=2815396 RepID=UPI0025E2AD22|nr:pentapeptide repeat-containing protein [Nostoc sp. JL33]MBN3872479.1 pentapeptide repeat-containing protein [Nostoc sp. JL33]
MDDVQELIAIKEELSGISGAKLIQTQLDGTDFTGATLTGATIEDWGITSNTKLHGVRCEYIFMRTRTQDDPNRRRKPDNWNETFADGDFADFIKPIIDTLDLYHNQNVDPRAIAISFKQLAENHPEADLRIVGMEVRGEDKFLLRAKTTPLADKSQLSAEYFDTYNEIKGLPEREIKLLLAEKDSRIRSLEIFVNQALQRPSFYSSTQIQEVGSMASNPGGFSVGGSVGGNVNNVQGEGNRVVQGDTTMAGDRNINTGGGNYNERIERDYIQGNYYAAGQPQSLAEAAVEIQLLLKQLEQTYPTTTTSQQMVVAAEAIKQIESNPSLKKRAINAAKEGGLAAFEKAIDNPAGAFIVNAIKGWQEVKNV